MREAAVPGFRLSKATLSNRVLITCAMMGIFVGLLSSVFVTLYRTGFSPENVANYYLGSSDHEALGDLMISDGPRPIAELAEVTHLHLLGGSILLFLICHLLALCDISERQRLVIYIASFSSFIMTFAAPWLIVFVTAKLALLFSGSVTVLLLTLTYCCLVILNELWLAK